MRLIDADKLRDYAFEVYHGNGVELETIMVVPLCDINNAPTIKPFILEDIEGVRAETIKMMENRYARLRGEWLWNEQGYFYCNKCNRQPRDQYAVTNFCPNCGARMKGGAE